MEENELEEIRRRVDIVDLIGHYVTLKKAGSNFKAICPFHQERTPSMMVSPEKQIFKCFGCNEGGDIFSFMMKIENLTFPEAVRMLADRAGVQLTERSNRPQMPKETKNELYAINELASKYWQTILWKHAAGKSALEYLHERGLNDETIKLFGLGYAPAQRGLESVLQKRGYSTEKIAQAGRPERFFKRIMFPIWDTLGNVIAFTGRVFPESEGPKYLNTPETTLFHKGRVIYGLHLAKQEIKKAQAVVFVEGQMDVISSHQAGVVNVVASSGTALTMEHFQIMSRFAPKFILAMDNDEAGQLAVEKTAAEALKEGYSVAVVRLPKTAKDPGELASGDAKAWQECIKNAMPAVDWFLGKATEKFAPEGQMTAEAKKNIAKMLLPIVRNLPDVVEQAHYVQLLAKKLSVKEEVINEALAKLRGEKSPEGAAVQSPADLQGTILGYFLKFPEVAWEFREKLSENLFGERQYASIVKELKIWYNQSTKPPRNTNETTLLNTLRKNLTADDIQKLNKIMTATHLPESRLEESNGENDALAVVRDELSESLEHLRELSKEKSKEKFAEEIAAAESAGDRERVKQLLKDLQVFLLNVGGNNNGQKDSQKNRGAGD